MTRTKKVGSTGRFGPRYGSKLRRRVLDVETKRRAPHKCPKCQTASVYRIAAGIWKCRKCGNVFTGGAYVPVTPSGKMASRTISSSEYE